jgi:hypothetical protein
MLRCIFVIYFIMFVFCRFGAILIAANHLLMLKSIMFHIVQNSLNFSLQMMTLVSSASIMGSDKTCIFGFGLFMYILKIKGRTIGP